MMAEKQSAVDDDDVPPLEDMSEYITNIESKEAVPKKPTNRDSSLLSLEDDNQARPGLVVRGGENGNASQTEILDSKKPSTQAMKSKSDFGGMKKGFLFNSQSKGDKVKLQSPAGNKEQDIPLLTAQPNKGNSLKLDEVQEEMKKSYPLLAGKDWITEDLLSKIEQNPVLAQSFADPSLSRVLEDFHRDPQDTLARAKDDPKVEQFLKEFCALMGSHFTSLADKEEEEEEVKMKPQISRQPSEEELMVKEMLKKPEIQAAFQDPTVQKLFTLLKTDPMKAQRLLQTVSHPQFQNHVQVLISHGLLGVERRPL